MSVNVYLHIKIIIIITRKCKHKQSLELEQIDPIHLIYFNVNKQHAQHNVPDKKK